MQNKSLIRQKNKIANQVNSFIEKTFINQKLNNWLGILFVIGIACMFGYMIARQPFFGMSLFGFVLGFFTVILCFASTETGLYINIFYAFFAFHVSRYLFNDEFPVGVIMDILIGTTFLSLLVNKQHLGKSMGQLFRTPVGIMMIVLVLFLLMQMFNIYGHAFEGWFQSFRRFLGSVLLLIISYSIFITYEKIKRLIIVLFVLCVITAIYACIQQYHGLFDFEYYWVTSNPNRYGLYFIMGDFRKFSTMSDPTAFAIAMSAAAVFFLIIAWHLKRPLYKYILIMGIILMVLGMAYSGTRTANVQAAAGITMFVLLSLHKKPTRIFAVVMSLVFLFLLYGPYVNSTIIRFRSSFIGSEDASYKVRDINRAMIQPYIRSHPFGGGLGTSGASGLRFNRGHELAGFPSDSGYLRKAVETGWIGLFLICLLYFLVIKAGIRAYFASKDPKLKVLYAACTAAIFSFYIAEFGQEAIGQITDIVIYYPMIAIILRSKSLETKEVSTTETAD